MEPINKKILIITGPTATGKTALAVRLAKKFNGELVSADSRQVYRGMDIGTGKDLKEKFQVPSSKFQVQFKKNLYKLFAYDLDGVSIWMYDVVEPGDEFSVSHWRYLVGIVIDGILSRGNLPIVVGGTGLYIRSLLLSIDTIYIPQNTALRKKLSSVDIIGLQKLLPSDVLEGLNESDRVNPRRLVRKIEIAQYDGKKYHSTAAYHAYTLGLVASLPYLYERIDKRVDERVKEGIQDEIRGLRETYPWEALSALGYIEWKEGGDTNEMIQQWKFDEHAYARRQMSWLRRTPPDLWGNIQTEGWEKQVTDAVSTWYTEN